MNSEMLWALIKIIVFLPLVTALAYFLIRVRKLVHPLALGGRRRMRLVEQVPLSPKSYVSLVEVGGRYVVLAHSDNGFQVIREMDELPDPILMQEAETPGFKDVYQNLKRASGDNLLLSKLFFRKGKER
ncbi:MAG: flagellar biosynthetic protein FliO [Actinobacteria bacterium]|nr:flagellar biosynthetic protein FliO [Actinomycetota bacterium]